MNIRTIYLYLCILAFATTFHSCYNYKTIRLLQEDEKGIPNYPKISYSNYKIRVNDEIIFRLITSDETISKLIAPNNNSAGGQNQMSYRVFSDSTIDLPFVSKIKIGGMTIQDASIAIQNRIRDLIPDAQVKLNIASKLFYVVGDAGSGAFQIYKEKLTIFQALAMSGDLSEQIDKSHIKIIRETDKGREILEFDIRPKSIIDSKYYYVYPNDIIYIRRSFSSFYKVSNYSSLLGIINFSVSLLFTVMIYNRK